MKKIELGFSSLCFLLAAVAALLLANDMVSWGFFVAWGGSAVVTVVYAYAVRRRRRARAAAEA
ncbi:MAG TPA: hypothetical protein VMM55_08480 [Thermohalobaculum sp.]|nr:hypothetical protein [Thermohalobaculum sp.]